MARTVNVGTENLSNGAFEAAPVGTKVRAVVYEIEETTVQSNAKGNAGQPKGVVTVKILDGFVFNGSDGKPQNLKGREVRYNNVPFYKSDNAWVLAAFGAAVGWDVDSEGNVQIPETHELAQATQGKEVVVKLGIRTSQSDGRKFNTVSGWLPSGSKTSANAGGGGAATGGGSPGEGNPWA